jgi:CheY-like chemotaxis protein
MNDSRQKRLVILVDDEREFLEIASLKLQSKGFDTVQTNRAEDAIAKAEELKPDLILSDIFMMPGPNGWNLALELRRNPKTRDIKLAFFTSLSEPWMEIPAEMRAVVVSELKNVPFLSKIEDIEDLGEKVIAILKN